MLKIRVILSVVVVLFVFSSCSDAPARRTCSSTGDCVGGEQCLAGVCNAGGSKNSNCTKNADCTSGSCQNGICEESVSGGGDGGTVTTDGNCTKNVDCSAGKNCISGKCRDNSSTSQKEPFEAFTAQTVSFTFAPDLQLSLVDKKGVLACGLSNKHDATPGTAGHQIFLTLDVRTNGAGCPTKTISIVGSDCSERSSDQSFGSCAWYRKWDAQGKLVGAEKVMSGAVAVSSNNIGFEIRCRFQVELVFSGGKEFKLNTEIQVEGSGPFCKEI